MQIHVIRPQLGDRYHCWQIAFAWKSDETCFFELNADGLFWHDDAIIYPPRQTSPATEITDVLLQGFLEAANWIRKKFISPIDWTGGWYALLPCLLVMFQRYWYTYLRVSKFREN